MKNIHISSALKIDRKFTIKHQTMTVCYGKLHRKLNMIDSDIIQMKNREAVCIREDKGLTIRDSMGKSKIY